MQSDKKVKTVLILAFFYPPENKIGAIRLSKFSKYLLKHGIKPIVVTSAKHNTLNTIEPEIPEELIHYVDWFDTSIHIQKLYDSKNPVLHFIGQVLFKLVPNSPGRWPEIRTWFWRKPAFKKSLEIISKEKIDVILSTSPPPAAIFIASKLKKKTGIPWVTDYRDPWSFNPYIKNKFLINCIDSNLEKNLLKNVDAIVTVSTELKNLFVDFAVKKAFLVYNGFDTSRIYDSSVEPTIKSDKLSIIHTGTLYKDKSDPIPLFRAVNILRKKGVDISKLLIQFYGSNPSYLKKLADEYEINDIVELKGSVDRSEIEKIQRSAGILLLLVWKDEVAKITLTGKFFEYLVAKRPILAIAYPGEIKRILSETKTGILLNQPEEIADFLENSLGSYNNDPNLGFGFSKNEIDFYSRENQTLKLIEVFNEVIK